MKNIYIIIYKKNLIKHIFPLYPYLTFLRIVIPLYCIDTDTDTDTDTYTLKHTHVS